MQSHPEFDVSIAGPEDVDAIMALMARAIDINMRAFLSPEEIEAAKETMGVDQTLIDDGTYFLIVCRQSGTLAGCGGWGKRRTLFGGNHTAGRDDRLSDPAAEPARIRAMYTHPDFTRRGIGKLLLALGENAASDAGFRTIELGATTAGEPLYLACGYVEIWRRNFPGVNGADNLVIKMRKAL